MPITEKQIEDIARLVEEYVKNHVKCDDLNGAYDVDNNSCYSLEEAIEKSIKRCPRPAAALDDVEEMDKILKEILSQYLEELNCIEGE